MEFDENEQEVYTQLQKDILQAKYDGSYDTIRHKNTFAASQQISKFLFRTLLGFRLESINCDSGPIPLVPDICVKRFKEMCISRAAELNCVYTHKAISYLEQALAENTMRAYELAQKIRCPFLATRIIKRLEDTTLSSQWFHNFCKQVGVSLLNPQSLEDVRRKYCNSNAITQFYIMLNNTIHQIPHLLYNMDETSVTSDRKGKIVVPDGYFPLSSEEKNIGHITIMCSCNAAGEALKPFIILPLLKNLPEELKYLSTQCQFASSPSGWVSSKLFFAWSVFFAAEIKERRKKLQSIYGPLINNAPCFLFLDGHRSRLNAMAIELLYANNIRIIVLPAHTSHVTQPFDVAIAAPFKTALRNAKSNVPQWMERVVAVLTKTARERYLTVIRIIDSWHKAATITNIKSGFEKAGIYPLNMQRVLDNKYVRKSVPGENIEAENQRNLIQINGMEITTFNKRLEISKHFYNNQNLQAPVPLIPQQMLFLLRNGNEMYIGPYENIVVRVNQADLNLII